MIFFSKILIWLKDKWRGVPLGSVGRSNKWPKVRADYVKEHPVCFCCGGTKKLEVHHVQSFHLHPDLELEPINLLTLCEAKKYGINCHLFAGHSGNYRNENLRVIGDIEYIREKLSLTNKI